LRGPAAQVPWQVQQPRIMRGPTTNAGKPADMDEPLHHPIYECLLAPADPIARHSLLHDMEQRLSHAQPCPKLQARVRSFVARGVPYFAPADARYREWAARAAQLWDELHSGVGTAAASVSPAAAAG
jgi:hypothetical protein